MEQNRTVVGVFEDYSKAESVARELEQAGIPRSSIDVQSNFRTGAAGRTSESGESHEGGISGFFHRLFGSDDSDDDTARYRDHYSEAVRRGNAVVCVTAPDNQVEEAVRIMNGAGAVDIDRHVKRFQESGGYERYDPNAPAYSHDEAVRERERFLGTEQGTSIPVLEEELQVGKRVVQRGGVRIYSQVVDQPVEESIELREERVKVERRPANRPATGEDRERLRNQSIEVTEMAEEPVVSKRARVREEVVVGKDVSTRTEKVRDTVRRTEVKVEKLGREKGDTDYTADFRSDWQQRYGSAGEDYAAYEPAYEYGYRAAGDPQYKGRDWSDVEETLRTDYLRNNPNSSWDRMKGAVRYGWEKMTGKR